MPITANNKPNHFPKINPANKAKGEPNPAAKTQRVENMINNMPSRNKFVCLSS